MTVAIKESLTKLHESLKDLEQNAAKAQVKAQENNKKSAKKGPPDLFTVPTNANGEVDAKALASRLDSAIAKVENLLKEEA